MAGRVRKDIQKFVHDNFSITSVVATKTAGHDSEGFDNKINYLLIENMDSEHPIYVSFDAGTSWKTLKAGYSIDVEVDGFLSYQVKAGAGTTVAVEALYGVEA